MSDISRINSKPEHRGEVFKPRVAEGALGEPNEIFRRLVDAVNDYAIFALDPDGNILTWNAGARRLKGYEAKEVIGTHFSRFYSSEDIARKHPQYELEQATLNGAYEEEGWRIKKDGGRFWASVVITALKDETGALRGFAKVTRDLTTKKMAEDKIRESEERFRLLVTNVQDYSIITLDVQGRITTWNTGAERIKGYKPAEIIGRHFSAFYPAEDIESGKPEMELRIAEGEGRYEEENWRVRKDRSLFWANVTITAMRDENGVLKGFAKVTRDLTARKQAEDALKQSQERYRLLVDGVKDYAIIMLDPRGRITSWNEGARRIKGYETKEILGSHFSRFYTKEDVDAGKPETELRVAAETGHFEDEGYRVRKDGSRFWANVVITPIRDTSGTLRGFSKVTRDVTVRRDADEVLKQSEERFRLMIEGVRDYAIFMLDPQGNVATWNEGARRTKGYESHEIIGKHFSTFYPREDLENSKPAMELKVAANVGRFEDTGWRIRKDGSRFWANVIITAVRDPRGDLLGFSKVTRDLTERKIAEDELHKAYENLEDRVKQRTGELAKAKEEAECAVRARDEFLSIASHELKTPLTSLKLQIQMRKRNLAKGKLASFSPDGLKEMAEDDEKQINRVTRLVDDMLDITRLTAGKLSLERSPTELGVLVREVLKRFAPQLESAGISVTLDQTAEITGQWDRYRIEQVFTNLLTNAMKYGAGKPVEVILSQNATIARLVVRDHGIGIAQEDHARMFQQFERAVAANGIGGLGLGLYIVRQIVETHGGMISIESEVGHGSAFTVELPLHAGVTKVSI